MLLAVWQEGLEDPARTDPGGILGGKEEGLVGLSRWVWDLSLLICCCTLGLSYLFVFASGFCFVLGFSQIIVQRLIALLYKINQAG